jgi:hypothetical protein
MKLFRAKIIEESVFNLRYPKAHEVDRLWGGYDRLLLDSDSGKYFQTVWESNWKIDTLLGYCVLSIKDPSEWRLKIIQERNRIQVKDPECATRLEKSPLFYGSAADRVTVESIFKGLKKIAERNEARTKAELYYSPEEDVYFRFGSGGPGGSFGYTPVRIRSPLLWKFGYTL